MSILFKESGGSIARNVASGTTSSITNGQPVLEGTNGNVKAFSAGTPVIGTDKVSGFAQTNSTETATLAGTVDVERTNSNKIYLGIMDVSYASTITNQAQYDALVGKRVVFGSATINGVVTETIMNTDGATNGLVIEPLDFQAANPTRIAYSVRTQVLANF